jgi:ribosomal protein S18 acetylase RimI-like enzyme
VPTTTTAVPPLRAVPWPGAEAAVQLLPSASATAPTLLELRSILRDLRRQGAKTALTSALDPSSADVYREAGFSVRSELVLLQRSLRDPIVRAETATHRIGGGRWGELAAIDRLAFGPFWGFDKAAVSQAVHATESTRVRAVVDDKPVAYAVSGVAGRYGYLQRLAVDPKCWGKGYGATLVLDALGWMRRRGARTAIVNTGNDNERALALYERHEFVRAAVGLCIMGIAL